MRSILRSFSTPLKTSSTTAIEKVSPTIRETQDDKLDKLTQFKQSVKYLDIPEFYDEDEFCYMKWLRARGYKIDKAEEMLKNHIEWRENCTYLHESINFIAPEDVLDQFKWKHLGNDPKGRPIFCLLGGRVDPRYLLENCTMEDVKLYMHKCLETLQSISDEQRRKTGYGKIIIIMDMTGFTFAKTMNIEFAQLGIYFARIFESNYPELLYKCFVLNANWFFTTTYTTFKVFLSQETLDKMQIYGSDQSKYLPYMLDAIPNELIPEEYGGLGDSIEEFEIIP